MNRSMFGALVLACALSAGSTAAQTRAPDSGEGGRGVVLGVNVLGTSLAGQPGTTGFTSRGAGVGLTLGYGINPAVTLFARGMVAYQAANVDVGARYTFGRAASALRPYVEGAVSRVASTAGGVDSHGYGVVAAAGVEYSLARGVAVDVGLAHTEGRFTTGALDGGRFAGTRVSVGVRWTP